jgi:uncharacterized protein (TIGR02099 family)
MIARTKKLIWLSYWVLVALLGLSALLVVTLRLVYPALPDYQQSIESHLSEALDSEVSFTRMNTYWRGQNPVLELEGLRVSGATEVTVDNAVLALDLPRSLAFQQLVFTQLEVNQPYIKVVADLPEVSTDDPSSRPLNPDDAKGAQLLSLLLRQERISVSDASIELHVGELPPVTLTSFSAHLRSSGQLHQLKVGAALTAGGASAPFRFVAEVNGSPARRPLNFYFDLPGMPPQVLNPWFEYAGLEPIKALDGHIKLWGAYRRNALEYAYLDTQISTLQAATQSLTDTQILLSLQPAESGYQAQLSGKLTANDKPYELPLVTANWEQGLGLMPDQLAMDSLDLKQLKGWLDGQSFLPHIGQRAVTMLNPRGYVEQLDIRWTSPEWTSFVANADLVDVSVSPWGGAPGLRHITGRLRHDIGGGSVDLDNNQFAMSFPDLKMPEWQYSFARGHVNWRLTDSAVEVGSGLLQLKNEDVTASGRFFFRLPYDKEGQTDLTLLIGVRDSLGTAFKDYIPPKEVGVATHKWLMSAIQGGQVHTGGFMLNANTRSRLPDYQKPVVQLFLDVDKLQFGFDPSWPSVTQGKGYFLYRDFGFLTEASGRLLDSRVKEAWVYSAPGATRLQILGNAQGDAKDIRKILLQTPIRSEVGSELPRWEWSAKADTKLDIDIALNGKRAPVVKASTRLREGRFISVENRLSFEKISGELRFSTETGLKSKRLDGRLFGQPVKAVIESSRDETSGQLTRLVLDGKADIRQVQEWLNQPYLAVAEGQTAYRAELELCTGSPLCNQLKIRSDLVGISVEAPAPLGKEPDDPRLFDVLYTLGDESQQRIWLNYGGDLRAVFHLDSGKVKAGQLVLGADSVQPPSRSGLWIDGTLTRLDIAELRRFLSKAGLLPSDAESHAAVTDVETELLLEDIRLQIGELVSGGLTLPQLQVEVRNAHGGWQINGENRMLKGRLFLPDDKRQISSLTLDYLKIERDQFSETGNANPNAASQASGFSASELPVIDLNVKSVEVRGKPYGAWSMEMRPDAYGATFQNVRGDMFGVNVSGDARWSTAGIESSAILLKFEGDTLDPLLKAWQYDRFIESQFLNVDANLVWEGAPWAFSLDRLHGHFSLLAKNGRIIEAGESGQFLRVLGILNLETLGRRLRLDFSDLFAQGLAFDRVSADYTLAQGVAVTRSPFKLKGPSADMKLVGSLDLVRETVDKDMEVVLPVTKNLPLMGVLLGQPQVAGAVYLIDKLIGDRLEKFTTIRYHLSGDWTDPQLELETKKEDEVPSDNPIFRQGGG